MARLLLTLVALLFTPLALFAQSPDDRWKSLESLRVGEKIEVVEKNLRSRIGTFLSVSPDALSFRIGADDVGIPRAEVLRVTSREQSRRLRNALIGAAIIGGIGTGVGFALDSKFTETNEGNTTKRYLIPISIAAGAAIGASRPGYRTIYKSQ